MANKNGLLRRTLDALIEGRSRQAQRYVDIYLKDLGLNRPVKPARR